MAAPRASGAGNGGIWFWQHAAFEYRLLTSPLGIRTTRKLTEVPS